MGSGGAAARRVGPIRARAERPTVVPGPRSNEQLAVDDRCAHGADAEFPGALSCPGPSQCRSRSWYPGSLQGYGVLLCHPSSPSTPRRAALPKGKGTAGHRSGPPGWCADLLSIMIGKRYAVTRGSSGGWRFVGREPGGGQLPSSPLLGETRGA
jgi:hypothetical protein